MQKAQWWRPADGSRAPRCPPCLVESLAAATQYGALPMKDVSIRGGPLHEHAQHAIPGVLCGKLTMLQDACMRMPLVDALHACH